MILSAASSIPPDSGSATPAPMPKVGEVAIRFRADESLYLGHGVGPKAGYASFDDALSAAAGISKYRPDGPTLAVVERGGRFAAHELLQPVWTKRFGREDARGYDTARLVPLEQPGTSEPRFGLYSYKVDKYGIRDDRQRTGRVKLDARAGVDALVGGTWALVDGTLRSVEAQRPEPPVDPKPPVDPNPPVDPTPPVDPPTPVPGRTLVEDVTEAARLATEALRIIGTVPPTDKGDESTKDVRIKAYKTNMAAQARIERQFDAGNPPNVVSTLRAADASLEDSNWQLAKKPSPDGRFNGVDVPGATRDAQKAVDLLNGLLDELVAKPAA